MAPRQDQVMRCSSLPVGDELELEQLRNSMESHMQNKSPKAAVFASESLAGRSRVKSLREH